ncbi:hypothetical protein K2173_000632 [Erythroxylum novogranatense]|uniref:Aminoacyl-tRNA synthetase class II (D/K/N) domain-containing protein n=1 Tax=Erythroxylum novogranatense TaxID=1862640 RepID=A0AAV8S7U3_9ROSI|nr:hypothetical protein K2173_000632 [Erythroxylum novogranatense]
MSNKQSLSLSFSPNLSHSQIFDFSSKASHLILYFITPMHVPSSSSHPIPDSPTPIIHFFPFIFLSLFRMASQEPVTLSQETKSFTSQETKLVSTPQKKTASEGTHPSLPPHKYSNRIVLKTLLERSDGGVGLAGQRVVIGGWVKSSKEVKNDPVPAQGTDRHEQSSGHKDVTCVEILQSRIPFFRSIYKILGGGGGGSSGNHPIGGKLEAVVAIPPSTSTAFLRVSDGSCAANLLVVVDSSVASTGQLLSTGTSLLAEGVLKKLTPVHGNHVIELQAEKILYVGTVEDEKYPLSKKRLPLERLRDFPHFRPRTTTVASVMRVRNALSFATHAFFQNHGFHCLQAPVVMGIDREGYAQKFQVTTQLDDADKEEETRSTKDTGDVNLEMVKAAINEKSRLVEELKRSESNREALAAAVMDLLKTNQLATQLEIEEKLKSGTPPKPEKVDLFKDFLTSQTNQTASGLLCLESYACALGNIYSFGPKFQDDSIVTSKNVAEIWMVEAQIAFSQLEDAMNCANDYVQFLCKWLLDNCSEDMKFITKRIDNSSIHRLQLMTATPWEKISYREAIDILKKVTDKTFETKLEWGVALTAEHLSYLADEFYKSPIVVYNYPKEVKPFHVRLNDDGVTVAAFDLVVPKVGVLISGSQSEERIDMLNTRIKEFGLSSEQYERYLDLRRHGTVKHSGFALGFDLMLLYTTGLTDIRDAIPFPRSFGKANN